MKKYLKTLSVLFIALVVLTGCGGGNKKTLTCTMEASESGIDMKYQVKVNYEEEKLKKLVISGDVEVDKQYSSSMSILKTSLDASLKEQFEDFDGASFDSKVSGNKYNFSIEVKNPTAEQEELSYDEAKEYFEANQFSCK